MARLPFETPNPFFRVAGDGRLLYVNPAGSAAFARWSFRPGEAAPPFLRAFAQESFLGNFPRHEELEDNGRCFFFTFVPVRQSGYVNVYARDITQQKLAERERRESRADLEAKNAELERLQEESHAELERRVRERTAELTAANEALRLAMAERLKAEERLHRFQAELAHVGRLKIMGEMATGLAHELNQPLTAILMQAELACRKLDLGCQLGAEELKKTWQAIADQAYRSGQIIRRMRDFVRKSEPVQAPLDFGELVDEVLSLLRSDLRHQGIRVSLDLASPLPKIVADKIQVQQVLLNLVRNAIEAMGQTPPEVRALGIRATQRDRLLEISLSDTGCGIPPDEADRLFSAFHSTKAAGMGLGLAICRSIVEGHGGSIWAAPNGERGTVFTLTLPTVR